MDSIKIYEVGEVLDTSTSPEEQQKINTLMEESNNIGLDMSRCIYVSSAGLRVMLFSYKLARAKGGQLSLIGVNDDIREVMTMTGFDKFFTFYKTVDECINT